MKYSDEQRIEKIRITTQKLLRYLQDENITPERVLSEEPIRWAITTPLYNIGEQAYYLSENSGLDTPILSGQRSLVCGIVLFMTTITPNGI